MNYAKEMMMSERTVDMKVMDLVQAIVLCLISYTMGLYVGKSISNNKVYDGIQVRDVLTGVFYGSYIIGGLKFFGLA